MESRRGPGIISRDGRLDLSDPDLKSRYTRCRLCLGRLMLMAHDPGEKPQWRHTDSRHSDPLPHEPQVSDDCCICASPNGDVVIWMKHDKPVPAGEVITVCGKCAIIMDTAPAALAHGMAVVTSGRRRDHTGGLDPAWPLIRERAAQVFIDISEKAVGSQWVGPDRFWSTSCVKVPQLPLQRRWIDIAWHSLLKNASSDPVRCPPHIDPSGFADARRIIRLSRQQAATAELVMVSADRCEDIYDRAGALPDLAFTAGEAEGVLAGGRVGIAIFDKPWYLQDTIATCVAIGWAMVPGGVWFAPYTHARCANHYVDLPDHALVPFSTGGFIPFQGLRLDPDEYDLMAITSIARVLVGLFKVAAEPAVVTQQHRLEPVARPKKKHRRYTPKPLLYRVMEVRKPPEPVEHAEAVPRSDPAADGYRIDYHYEVPEGMVWRWTGKRGNQTLTLVPRKAYTAGPIDRPKKPAKETVRKLHH